VANRWSRITIVAAITSQFDASLYPTEVLINAPEGGLGVNSVVLLNQIRSIDRKRLVRRLGTVKSDTINRVDKAVCISFGMVKI
jgi:mRNA interferase MazF